MHVYFTFNTGLLKSVYLFILMGHSDSYEGRVKSPTFMQIKLVTIKIWPGHGLHSRAQGS